MWVLWPLPSARFDWRENLLEQAAVGDCFHLVAYAGYATFVDPDGMEIYLDEMPLAQRCDYGAISSNRITHEDEAHIRELISETRRFERAIGGIVSPFSEAWWSWKTNRELRRQAGIGWLGLPELVWAFRCQRPFRFGDRANWLWAIANLKVSAGQMPPSGAGKAELHGAVPMGNNKSIN
jgi:hypothetical protein